MREIEQLKRRQFIRQLIRGGAYAGVVATGAGLASCAEKSRMKGPLILSASTDNSGQNHIGAYDLAGQIQASIPVELRGHGMLLNPIQPCEAIFFSRRPGNYLHRIDILDPEKLTTIASHSDRHLYGHGVFSMDANWLYTTENDFENGTGVVSVRDARTLQVEMEFPSYGVGPHELRLMPDGKTLVVANGGLLTHPSRPREVLNAETMQPSLVYIDIQTGALLGEYRLSERRLSIRHIDVNAEGRVIVTTQFQGDTFDEPTLVATHFGEDELQVFPADAFPWMRMKNYCGSVAFAKPVSESADSSELNNIAAVTSPRGGQIVLFDTVEHTEIASFGARDVCGVGYSSELDSFIATSGPGSIYLISRDQAKWAIQKTGAQVSMHWDNHLLVV